MRRPTTAVLSAAAALCLASVGLASTASAAPSDTGLTHRNTHVCADAPAGAASCDAIRRDTVDRNGNPAAPAIAPAGYGPADIRAAYGLTAAVSKGKTVAIVDAYDAPSAEADLATYRKQFGLPLCTTANGCFRKVNQTGSSRAPRANASWAQEISLDLDMVSAACPDCKILLVEANSASFADLGTAVNTAARLGAVAISNSYGGSDQATLSAYDHPNIAITASTGDGGYEVESPASFPTVIAVGGTSLTKAGTGYTESAWSGAGSGCSAINAKPSFQTTTGCGGKVTADVSAVADPATGVAVYDSYAYQGTKGWMVFGGTSASSPIVASVYAMGSAVGSIAYPASKTWANPGALNDVTTGSNGTCTTAVWCTAGTGWDGPTGLGTPKGTGAF
jgi:subtilase family serine protease